MQNIRSFPSQQSLRRTLRFSLNISNLLLIILSIILIFNTRAGQTERRSRTSTRHRYVPD